MHTYPGAGHLIESPYTPHCRAANHKPKAERKKKSFVPERFTGKENLHYYFPPLFFSKTLPVCLHIRIKLSVLHILYHVTYIQTFLINTIYRRFHCFLRLPLHDLQLTKHYLKASFICTICTLVQIYSREQNCTQE